MPSVRLLRPCVPVCLMLLLLLAGGCRSIVPVPPPEAQRSTDPDALTQRLVILVHGDAGYRYHTPDGTVHEADTETVREAVAAARSMPQAEVFIFHQRPHDPLLGLIPRDDGTMYHVRGGRLRHQITYDQTRPAPFTAEAHLLRTHRAAAPDSTLFTAALYYGHAVPERDRPGYHRSRPDVPFGVETLTQGLGHLRSDGAWDAVVLSTCDGGTPHTLAALAPHARHVLASPSDLHLSFIDADLLSSAPTTTGIAWTHRLAEQAFERLSGRVTTAVTLAAYDLDRAASTARRLSHIVTPDTSTAPAGARLVDCRRMRPEALDTTGVRVWDRTARFGPTADRPPHSGWGCRPAE